MYILLFFDVSFNILFVPRHRLVYYLPEELSFRVLSPIQHGQQHNYYLLKLPSVPLKKWKSDGAMYGL